MSKKNTISKKNWNAPKIEKLEDVSIKSTINFGSGDGAGYS